MMDSWETLVFKASSLEEANKLRHEMIEKFSGCWFYVYTQTYEIYVANEFGGRLKKELVQPLIDFCKVREGM